MAVVGTVAVATVGGAVGVGAVDGDVVGESASAYRSAALGLGLVWADRLTMAVTVIAGTRHITPLRFMLPRLTMLQLTQRPFTAGPFTLRRWLPERLTLRRRLARQ